MLDSFFFSYEMWDGTFVSKSSNSARPDGNSIFRALIRILYSNGPKDLNSQGQSYKACFAREALTGQRTWWPKKSFLLGAHLPFMERRTALIHRRLSFGSCFSASSSPPRKWTPPRLRSTRPQRPAAARRRNQNSPPSTFAAPPKPLSTSARPGTPPCAPSLRSAS